ncbi:hypothetical protein QJS10_CPA03g00465 [Acorus calamus]|uniref:Uncharacterized protein n=1 Tax=Acorus calamus TaxID=4465 RepID=A0AAV9F6A2_ACOCL|nr:hypothetical protein QJS10_CPA03g00465 [Acorus calamus]
MIKRRFYKLDHGDGDADSSSSSSSDSDAAISSSESESEDEVLAVKEEENPSSASSSSGYESEESSGDEVDHDSSVVPVHEEEEDTRSGAKYIKASKFVCETQVEADEKKLSNTVKAAITKDPALPDFILKCKSVFKCRLCPSVVLLNEGTLKDHLTSKRHACSKKLLDQGKLKVTLNSDGEIEEEQETHAERHARTVALAKAIKDKESTAPKKKNKGRQRQRERLKKTKYADPDDGKAKKRQKKLCNPTTPAPQGSPSTSAFGDCDFFVDVEPDEEGIFGGGFPFIISFAAQIYLQWIEGTYFYPKAFEDERQDPALPPCEPSFECETSQWT